MRDVFKNIVDSYESTDVNDLYEEEQTVEPENETAPDEVVPVILEEHLESISLRHSSGSYFNIDPDGNVKIYTEVILEEAEDEAMKQRLTLGLHSDSLDHHSDGIRKHASEENEEEFSWEVIKHHLTGIKEIVDKIEAIIPTEVPESFDV